MSFSPIKDRKVRFCLVGCGRISKNHFLALHTHREKAELVSVCDIDSKALEWANKETGAKPFSDYSEMLKHTDADVVVLTTPSGLHPEQAILAAQEGFHVVSEKPMATRWEDGLKMVKAADEAGVSLFVVKQNRKNPTLQNLKAAIDLNRFGKLYFVTANVFWTRPQEYYDAAKWRGTWELDGGALMNQASHYVDLLQWLAGPVESLQAYTATLERKIEAEDTGVVNLKWKSGALGSLNVTMLTYPKNLEGSITVLGEKGTVRIGGMALNEIQHWDFKDKTPQDDLIKSANYNTASVYGPGHTLYYENIIDVFRGEAQPDTDGREGLKSLELLIASYRSAQDGKRISLPLEV